MVNIEKALEHIVEAVEYLSNETHNPTAGDVYIEDIKTVIGHIKIAQEELESYL